MSDEKQDRKSYLSSFKSMKNAIQKIMATNQNIINENCSLQNLVEKYMPLKLLTMIVEATEDSFLPAGK